MPEPTNFSPGSTVSRDPQFQEHPRTTRLPPGVVAVAVVAVAIVIGALLILERHHPAPGGGAAYAANLQLTNLRVSQAESLSGGRSTYVDGTVANRGNETVTGATVQAQFAADGGQAQTLSTPLSIIRTRQPYIDTQPLSAAPLAPGGQADFRLIFEGVNDGWNQQAPALQITQVSTR